MARILIVEDNEELLALVSDFFRSKGSFDVDTAPDGNCALSFISVNEYDLAILDIMLPGTNGFDVCKALRGKSKCPIVFLTALGTEENILRGYEIGADEYMVKPFSLKVLYAKCLALLNRTEAELQKELVLECGDIKLYPLRMEVEAGGSKVVLAPKEYFLLKTLMENKGIVLGRDRLLDLVWGLGFDGSDRVVDTHIKKLRKALGHSGEAVRTVIGGGYKIM
ncbi:MAG: response regulator transcription factor [Clostridiales bacterium]|nr:response regulator transcription factor [Clostridiales bacterium]MBQ2155661.1 response regulator transcription factor [Clostridiales bacterium]MBQ5519901.1 response regulator transcription factor [Clostridiales bacterium]